MSSVANDRGAERAAAAERPAGLERADRPLRILRVADVVDNRLGGMSRFMHFITDELRAAEYREGVERLEHLCEWLRPDAVAVVGLAGWRAAVDRKASVGWQARTLGPSPVYVLPSTSGLNAGTSLDDLVAHLLAAVAGPSGHARAR